MHPKIRAALLACAALVTLTASVSPAMATASGAGGSHAADRAESLTWKLVPSPNGDSPDHTNLLFGVSCPSAGACVAVGYSPPKVLAESWNGTAWKLMAAPALPSAAGLNGVSCVSARFCAAVGGQVSGSTLVETWNGTAWTVAPSPSVPSAINGLSGVSCISARACTAVGSFQPSENASKTLIESWNGTAWTIVPSPNVGVLNSLSGVSCISARACTAVGAFNRSHSLSNTLIESWNGTTWTIVPSPATSPFGGLNGVSCVSARACTAVGGRGTNTLIESWNGTAWTIVPSPNEGPPSALNDLDSVSCASIRACTAVGNFSYPFRHHVAYKTLVESWNGTRWTVIPSPNKVGGTKINVLFGVSCPSPAMCMAAGNAGGSTRLTLTEIGTSAG